MPHWAVNPACAGMIRIHRPFAMDPSGKPRVCGDDPATRARTAGAVA